MKVLVKKSTDPKANKAAPTLVVFATATTTKSGNKTQLKVSAPGATREMLDLIAEAQSEGSLRADKNETTFFRNANIEGYKHLMVVGLGDGKKLHTECIRQASAAAFKALNARKYTSSDYHCDSLLAKFGRDVLGAVSAAVEGAVLADYEFDEYKNKPDRDKAHRLQELGFYCSKKTNVNGVQKGIDHGLIISDAINFTRHLGDTPGNLMTPTQLGKETQNAAKGTKLKVTVWNKDRIEKEKMGGLMGVSLGSDQPPTFIVIEYKGAAASKKPICFVGKGLTFDSGGISIKPSLAMDEMKYDMQGGATVIGAMLAIARLKLKINAICFVPASENMPGPSANKPGDVLTARNGKTVEVLNTDAEGRLILMDALSYATEKKPAVIYDAATLTGAMVIALGNIYAGVFTRNKSVLSKVQKAADVAGEKVWHMPIDDAHVKAMKGLHADLANISNLGRGAGSSTAAAFLEQFVGEDIPWAHFDIAGTAWDMANQLNYCPRKGASGYMVRTFVELAKQG